jgi:hypothetical protein
MGQRDREWRATVRGVLFGLFLWGLIFLAFRGCAEGGETFSATWSERTTSFAVLAAYAAIDFDQSAGLVTPGGRTNELNPILGEHPTRQDMLAFGVVGMGLLYLASEILPEPWDRIVVDSAVTSEGFNIEENVRAENARWRGFARRIEGMPILITVRF